MITLPLVPMAQSEINMEELDRIKKLSPLEFYEMGAAKRFMCNLLVAQAEFNGLIDTVEWCKQVGYEEVKINWVGIKNDMIEYFPTYREVESKFGIKINQIRSKRNKDKLDGWELERVNLVAITDYQRNILKIKNKNTLDKR